MAVGTRPASDLPSTEIRFEDLSFTYPGSSRPVFEGLDLTVPVGSSLAIVGANGAGKTTLIKLLARNFTDGCDLSGGEWQRVALARALFAVEAGAGVLALDEPTANLDVRAEAELFERLLDVTSGPDCRLTTLLVSHRFSTIRRADRICVLQRGRVAELGTHDELLAAGGRYARMFGLQAARFDG